MPHLSQRRVLARALAAGAGLTLAASLSAAPARAAPVSPSPGAPTSPPPVPSLAALTLTAPAEAEVGQDVEVVVELADVVGVYAYEVTLEHDPALLTGVATTPAAPAGGFDSATTDGGTTTFIHTRLGTSPALDGSITVGTLALTAAAPGTTTVTASVELVGPDGEILIVPDAAATTVVITAAFTVEPTEPEPTNPTEPTGSTEPTTDAGVAPTGPSPADPSTTDPTTAASSSASTSGTGPLASTGAQVGVLAAVAALAVAAGVLLLRRRAVTAR